MDFHSINLKWTHTMVRLALVALILVSSMSFGTPDRTALAAPMALTAEKIALSNVIYDGGTIDFQIVLHNDSAIIGDDVVVTDVLNPRLEVIDASNANGSVVTSTDAVTYTVMYIPATSSITLTLQARVRESSFQVGEVISNVAMIDDGTNPVFSTNPVTFTMSEYVAPTSQIDDPWDGQRFTNRGSVTIKGRVWIGQTPEGFPVAPFLNPVNNSGGGDYTLSWESDLTGVYYTLQESTSSSFTESRTQEWTNLAYDFQAFSKSVGVYYYRVKAYTANGPSRWSNVRTVTVTTSSALTNLNLPSAAGMTFSGAAAPLAVTAVPTVEVLISGGSGTPEILLATVVPDSSGGDWWSWSCSWTLPVEDSETEYTIQSRAYEGSNYDPSLNDMITVFVENGTRIVYFPFIAQRYPPVPYGVTLNIASNDGYGTYQLGWTYNQPGDPYAPTGYHLQEATDAAFTNLTYEAIIQAFEYAVTDKDVGTYYYRVRGVNNYGVGVWSNVAAITVQVRGYTDDFSDSTSGWPKKVYYRASNECSADPAAGPLFDVNYENGSYRVKLMLNDDGCNNRRMGLVPSPYGAPFADYDLSVTHRFTKADDQVVVPEFGKAGVVFAANSNFTAVYVVEWNIEGRCSVAKYSSTVLPTTIFNTDNVTYIKGWSDCSALGYPAGESDREKNYDRTITVKASVASNSAIVYINNVQIAAFTSSDLNSFNQVGLMTGSWDRTPVESRFDNFSLMPR